MAKAIVQNFKKSIKDSGFSENEINIIWDFYVTKSVAASASQKRTPSDYGSRSLPWSEMKTAAGFTSIKILAANSINKTLADLDLDIDERGQKNKVLGPKEIDIDYSRLACVTPYTIADEEEPKAKIGEAESVLTHIRNAFAHGNTYFFDNGFMLLEDKSNGVITARIMMKRSTLIEWIHIVDKEGRYYPVEE